MSNKLLLTGYQLGAMAALVASQGKSIPMTIPNRYGGGRQQGKSAALEAEYPELKKKWPNAPYGR